jgi:hypothetical protein
MARMWMVDGHQFCDGCFNCEEDPCLGEEEKSRAVKVDSEEGYCACCGQDVDSPE